MQTAVTIRTRSPKEPFNTVWFVFEAPGLDSIDAMMAALQKDGFLKGIRIDVDPAPKGAKYRHESQRCEAVLFPGSLALIQQLTFELLPPRRELERA